MPMGILRFGFATGVDERTWRERLRAEVGARSAGERNVETSWRDGTLEILSMDWIALAYAGKVSVALGGEPVAPTRATYAPAAWTATRWVAYPWWTRVRLWIGPTRM